MADPTATPDSHAAPAEGGNAARQETARAIGRATAVIVGVGLLDKLLAVGKEVLMAARFGVDPQVDAFNIAYAFPGIINLLCNGACVSAFVPLFAAWRASSDKTLARDAAVTVAAATSLFFVLAAWAAYACAPLVIDVIGYGFAPAVKSVAAEMERALVWLMALEGLGLIAGALLQSFKRFGLLTLAQTAINLAIIAFLAGGAPLGIEALILGFLVGTALKVAALFASLRGLDLRSPAGFRPRFDALGRFVRLAWPLLGSALVANSNILIDQSMTTVLPAGAVAVLRYAYRVNDLPLQVVVLAVSRAMFPFISEQAAADDKDGMRHVFRQSLVFVALVCAPVTCYMLVFADDVVTALLRRGAFDTQAAAQTALTLRCYALGLFFHAYTFINGAFYSALRRGGLLLRMGFVALGLNYVFNRAFLYVLGGPEAIALSTTVTMAIISCIFFAILRQLLGVGVSSGLGRAIGIVLVASGAASAACWPVRAWAASFGGGAWTTLATLSPVFVAVYAFAVLTLRNRDIDNVVRLCLPRFRTKP